ncbi:hypothetical protein [Arabiibacter massiliensis]|uniref:hypothetical protein n=1 Tax=Arabiibacter massiliensis TaxID=1870985 RepID=UPI0009B9CAD0|nr:hypothetical protein [Arabiibacter massiliensis]
MNLTFRGFLRLYCRELSGLQTDSIKKLCESAATDAPRLAEPLFLEAPDTPDRFKKVRRAFLANRFIDIPLNN